MSAAVSGPAAKSVAERTIRKLRIRIIPFVFVLYVIGYLDRVNIISAFWSLPQLLLSEAAAATGIALINSVGNLGGFIGPYIVGAKATESNVTQGLYFLAGSFVVATVLLIFLRTDGAQAGKEVSTRASARRATE